MVKAPDFISKMNLFSDLNVAPLFPRSYIRAVFLCHDGTDGPGRNKVNKNKPGSID